METLLEPIETIAMRMGINPEHFTPYGRDKAKVSINALNTEAAQNNKSKLILVSAITPTPSGEGKTTVSIGLAQGLKSIGKKPVLALREPSLGPVFGRKGGATGGGKSSITPEESINLHFNGDFHAITSAHNLISAVIDNQLFFHQTRLDPSKVTWKRVLDMNDRSLRNVVVGLNKQGVTRETSFDITPASEIMAIFCLATSEQDLRDRIDRIIIGFTSTDEPVYAKELNITGAVIALLKDAINPNLVQSLEGVPAFVHGGPFANIAHGCNSILATKLALAYGEYTVTEAGFAFDLGAEKFLDIKCRTAGFSPDAIVIVATARALKMHGGVAKSDLKGTDVEAVKRGLDNLEAHIESASKYNRPIVVAINKFFDDSQEELDTIHEFCHSKGIACATADIFSQGGKGGEELARLVVEAANKPSPEFKCLYSLDMSIEEKMETIAKNIYGADGVILTLGAKKKLAQFEACGLGNLPVCMAKTQNSLSDDAKKINRPRHFSITVRDFEIANGAGFIVALTGNVLRMPALPKVPSAEHIDVDANGHITGLMA